MSKMAAELVQLNVDVIVSGNTPALLALQKATRTIPIVMLTSSDPLLAGLAASLARPGGNITGLSLMTREASGKRLELLREVIPKLSRVIVLSNPENPVVVLSLQETRAAAQTFSLKLDSVDMRKPSELDRALSVIVGTAVIAMPVSLNLPSANTAMVTLNSADAKVGKPLSATSVAGVNRRQGRREQRKSN